MTEEQQRSSKKHYVSNSEDSGGDDPEPIADGASKQEIQEYIKRVEEYGKEMLQCFQESNFSGEWLLNEFQSSFRESSIENRSEA